MRLLACPAGSLCSQLKHSWLQNQVLNKTPIDVVGLHRHGWRALKEEFTDRVDQARTLAEDLEHGFSPAQLVDRLTSFRNLPVQEISAIKMHLHKAYLGIFDFVGFRAALLAASDAFEFALRNVIEQWGHPVNSSSEKELEKAWEALLSTASAMSKVLDQLPRTIVLP